MHTPILGRCLRVVATTVVLATIAAVAQAQTYPMHPVKVVVPYAAGGGADTLARAVSQQLTESLGQPFVVDNKPGAGGISATELVAKSPPDGYTLLLTDNQLVITPALFGKVPYDVRKELKPVSQMTIVPLFIVVRTADKIATVQELIALAKANPGKLNYGSAGVGSMHHIAMESFKQSLGLDIVHVPYKGSGQSIQGFLSGDVTILIASFPSVIAHVKSGNAKFLAVTSLSRSPFAADIPAIAEIIPGFDFASELGMLVPAGTPPAIVNRLSTAIAAALKQPDMVARLADTMGAIAVGSSADAYTEKINADLERVGKAVKASGATPQ